LVAPLGFFMGMPFPKGALRVGQLVDWGLAVNGAASVLGGTGAVLVAMTFGFRVALLAAAGLYLLAYLLISRASPRVSSAVPSVFWQETADLPNCAPGFITEGSEVWMGESAGSRG
jgi:hypothetical protein